MDPSFLVGKVIQDKWDFTITIWNGREWWEAGGEAVDALTTAEAAAFNAGIPAGERASQQPKTTGRRMVTPVHHHPTFYPERDHNPPVQRPREAVDAPSPALNAKHRKLRPSSIAA